MASMMDHQARYQADQGSADNEGHTDPGEVGSLFRIDQGGQQRNKDPQADECDAHSE